MKGISVTPFLGVWIEIYVNFINVVASQSLPSWECGLKLYAIILSVSITSHSLLGSVD